MELVGFTGFGGIALVYLIPRSVIHAQTMYNHHKEKAGRRKPISE
jgi:hypothetical protein